MPKPRIGQGDHGTTSLFGTGKKVLKHSARFHTLGSLDELNALIGFARTMNDNKEIDAVLQTIQNHLFVALSRLGIEEGYEDDDRIPVFRKEYLEYAEQCIVTYEKDLPALNAFIVPTGTQAAALLHMCRALTRQAERYCVALSQEQSIDATVLSYVNRLSDVFFTLARYSNYCNGAKDTLWRHE